MNRMLVNEASYRQRFVAVMVALSMPLIGSNPPGLNTAFLGAPEAWSRGDGVGWQ
jgi:hypothetical protein